jgi:hypothetical protein
MNRDVILSGGARLQEFLDGLPIEAQWLAGHHIVWQTGQQNGPDGVGLDDHTHCSALAAAIALDLDIYILRPPHHSQQLLSNAQMDWLGGAGTFSGPTAEGSKWRALGSSGGVGVLDSAVAAANTGKLVVAGYRQPPLTDPVTGQTVNKSGHVVIVRPQDTTISAEKGPLVTMAGDRNWRSIHMSSAFQSHPAAWPDEIMLYVHDTDLEVDVPSAVGAGCMRSLPAANKGASSL